MEITRKNREKIITIHTPYYVKRGELVSTRHLRESQRSVLRVREQRIAENNAVIMGDSRFLRRMLSSYKKSLETPDNGNRNGLTSIGVSIDKQTRRPAPRDSQGGRALNAFVSRDKHSVLQNL